MGQWAPSTFAANAKDADEVLGDLGWFPFPTVDGGAGAATEQFGGGDGFAIGKDAPPEAVDFVKFLVTSDVANKAGASGGILPVKKGTESSVTDPNMKSVLDARAQADVRPALPRSGLRAGRRPGGQRRGAGAVRGQGVAAGRRRQDRGCRQGRIAPRVAGVLPGRRPPGTPRACPAALDHRSRCSSRPRSCSTGCWSSRRSCRRSTTAASSGTGSRDLDDFVGLENFRRAFSDDVFTGALWHNGVFVVLSLAAAAAVRARRRADAATRASRAARSCASCTSRRSCSPRSSPASSAR